MAAVAGLVAGEAATAFAAPDVPPIRRGDGGHGARAISVRCVQHAFNDWAQHVGGGEPTIDEDRQFGQATFNAVEMYQYKHGLHVDGIVGKQTGDLLLISLKRDGGWRAGCYNYLPSTHH